MMGQKYKVITKDTFQEWQRIINAITNIAGVTVGLITRVLGNQVKTIVASQNTENPYLKLSRDSVIGSGIYCEQVIRNKTKLIINNALKNQKWENNFDLQYNLISYLGFPLRYSDNRIFGTICLLNNRETYYSDDLIYLLEKMRDLIESQIHEIENNWLDQLFVNKSLLKTIFDSIPVGIGLSAFPPNSDIFYVNPRFTNLFGYIINDIPTINDWFNLAYPDTHYRSLSYKLWFKMILQARQKKEIVEPQEFQITCKNGDVKDVLISVRILDNMLLSSFVDITKQKRTEAQLRLSEKRHRLLAEYATDNIWTMTPDFQFDYISPSIEYIRGYTPDEVRLQSFEQILVAPDSLLKGYQRLKEVSQCSPENTPKYGFRDELELICKDGSTVWTEVIITPVFDKQGNLKQIQGITRNITDRKNYEFELNKAHDQIIKINAELEERVKKRTFELKEREIRLEKTNQELIKANRLKDEFLAMMSHELRTPLNAILGMTEILLEKIYGEINIQQEQSLKTIENSGQHLLSLINDILDVTKIEAGKIDLNFKNISVYSVCESSLDLIQAQAQKKQIQLQSILPPDLPEIYADENRIRQVLLNLLNNAVKFTPNYGQVTLEAIYPPVSDNQNSRHLRLSVTDTGIGIARENIDKLFQPFVQIDSNLNRQYEGTGLGLVLVKKFVELHGGKVSFSSRVAWGSCFMIDLPIAQNQIKHKVLTSINKNNNTSNISNNRIETKVTKKQPLILLAEDNEANVISMQNYLEAKGYRLFIAMDGQEAISALSGKKPDLIVMDIQMPKLDGIRAIEYLKQNPDYCNIPIIAITAPVSGNDREKCLKAGADEYMSKPVRLRDLANHIQRLLIPIS
ncbi:PAS domain S-box protein [Cyanobacterium aponinum]|uniref:Circadian input-output histidine kinase CikA n=1 Tax=Cyanobacterium aponinum 0216 TaxID=2676140 RepID=A0A844GUX4_9CHRO|nr:PAS domain S-box protein [Cyanobacterium aponinum]MTF37856.1 PAS domain S-box protein [Cyanobacterium aponinum 0216]